MPASFPTPAPTGRKKIAQGNALGNPPQNISPEGAKEVGWPSVPLGEVVEFNTRFGKNELAGDSLASFIPMKCVEEESGRFEPLGDRKVSEVSKGYTPFRDGDVIFAKVTPCMENGKAAVLKGLTNGVGFGSTEFFALRPKSGLDAHYLFHFILQSNFRREAAQNMTGAVGLRRVPKQWLEQQTIPLPPLKEQRRIVAEIEKQFTRLEAGVAALRRVQANLKRYRAAVLKAACEGQLVPTEAELRKAEGRRQKDESTSSFLTHTSSFESGAELLNRILAERRKNWTGHGQYKEPAAPEASNLPTLPEGWAWATVEQISSGLPGSIQSGPFGSQLLHSEFVEDGILAIGIDNVRDGAFSIGANHRITKLKFKQLEKFAARPRDVLVTVMATVGRVCVLPDELETSIVTKHCYRITPSQSGMNSRFLSVCLRADSATRQYLFGNVRGQTRAGINGAILKLAPIPLPPLAEQTRIVAEVERRLSVAEELESVVSANLQRATRLRQSILQKAFTGELVAREATAKPDNVVQLPRTQIRPPNRHFARALLSAEIVHRLHNEPTFGRIKHQKIFHLCEHIAQIKEIEGQYHREVAGPLDNKLIYANEEELKKQKWYREVHRSSFGHAYEPLAKAGAHRKYVEGYWPDKLPVVEKLIEMMRTWDTDRCEIFCTAYAAWNDLILWGKPATDENVLHEILERWHDSKKRFPSDRWRKALAWMKEKGFVPTGFGKPTRKAE